MADQLSTGSLQVIMKGGTVEDPVMQILGIKKMGNGPASNRYRILVSDGKYLNSFAMLASQVNEKIESGELTENTIVRITRFITSMVNNTGRGDSKRVMVILDCDVVEPGEVVGAKIGDPIPYEDAPDDDSDTTVATRPENPAQPQQNQYRQTVGVVGSPVKATHPISSLNPYQNRWTIKARCTAKTPVKTWSNARSEGKLFSMDLLDESGEIRCTAFKEAVDKYYDMVECCNDMRRRKVKTVNNIGDGSCGEDEERVAAMMGGIVSLLESAIGGPDAEPTHRLTVFEDSEFIEIVMEPITLDEIDVPVPLEELAPNKVTVTNPRVLPDVASGLNITKQGKTQKKNIRKPEQVLYTAIQAAHDLKSVNMRKLEIDEEMLQLAKRKCVAAEKQAEAALSRALLAKKRAASTRRLVLLGHDLLSQLKK